MDPCWHGIQGRGPLGVGGGRPPLRKIVVVPSLNSCPHLRTMPCVSPWAAPLLPMSLVLVSAACAAADGEVVFPESAGFETELATGCDGPTLPVGRLRGYVYSLPIETRSLPDFTALAPRGTICLDHLDVTERRGYPGFPGLKNRFEWFGLDFQGAFAVSQPGAFHFRLTADDGANLYVDGALLINNDGYHVVRAVEAAVPLAAGLHPIAVRYWQGPGPLALILEVARPGEAFETFHLDRPL